MSAVGGRATALRDAYDDDSVTTCPAGARGIRTRVRHGALWLFVALVVTACGGASSDPGSTSDDGGRGNGAPDQGQEARPGEAGPGAAIVGESSLPDVLLAAPALPDLVLRNPAGDDVVFEELRGKPALMTFIYTRCPMPEMCPATTLRFQEVQKALSPQQRARVRLISVSFDPSYDTPEVLAEYAELWEVDASFWTMLTGAEDDIRALASSYGVWYEKSDVDDTFRHPMYSMILLPDGSLHRVLLGSVFDADEVAHTLLSLADEDRSMPR